MRQISDVDYTQPFGQRGVQDLGWKFHYFLLVLQGLSLISFLIGMFYNFDLISSLAVQGLFFYATWSKRQWLITLYQISFWLQLTTVVLIGVGLVLFCFVFSSMEALSLALLGFGFLLVPILLAGGFVCLVNLIVTPFIIKYYKKRRAYLR